jgi:alcohol dehydrogenase
MALADQVFGFYIPTVTLMGIGAHKELGSQIKTLGGKRPFICTDKGITKSGLTEKIVAMIREDVGVEAVVFDGTIPNPTDVNVHAGLKLFKDSNADMIISLGGGSSHDCGKGIGVVATNGGNIRDFEGINKSWKAMPPFIAINTTAGTASEMTRFCIITDTSRKVKMAIVDWRVTPNVAINDPLLMVGMPPGLTAATGMDALTHAVEA